MGLLQRTRAAVAAFTKAEGGFHPPPYALIISGGYVPIEAGTSANWWQLGYSAVGPETANATLEGVLSAYSQTIALCAPAVHWRLGDDGGRYRVENSALSRVMRRPNSYHTCSDFWLSGIRQLMQEGNLYGLCLRNDRFEISEIHLFNSWQSFPRVASSGEIFYSLLGNSVVENWFGGETLIVPQRDVLHIKLQTNNRLYPTPLRGVSPLEAAYPALAISNAIAAQQIAYYNNEARPSGGIIQTAS